MESLHTGYRANSENRVDLPVAVRLRRAILRNDALLVNRIIKNNPKFLRNPDFSDKSNTSLHLAAALGYLDVIVCLRLLCRMAD
jgi:hypothetical protein